MREISSKVYCLKLAGRPRVRPMGALPQRLRVEFPRHLREEVPIGTRFRADVYVRRKHHPDGSPNGDVYLRAENHSIVQVEQPDADELLFARQKPGTISGREPRGMVTTFMPMQERKRQTADRLRWHLDRVQRRPRHEVKTDPWPSPRLRLRLPDDVAQRSSRADSREGHAGDPDNAGRMRRMDAHAMEQGHGLQRPCRDEALKIVARGVDEEDRAASRFTLDSFWRRMH
jgi:hypothetical protein